MDTLDSDSSSGFKRDANDLCEIPGASHGASHFSTAVIDTVSLPDYCSSMASDTGSAHKLYNCHDATNRSVFFPVDYISEVDGSTVGRTVQTLKVHFCGIPTYEERSQESGALDEVLNGPVLEEKIQESDALDGSLLDSKESSVDLDGDSFNGKDISGVVEETHAEIVDNVLKKIGCDDEVPENALRSSLNIQVVDETALVQSSSVSKIANTSVNANRNDSKENISGNNKKKTRKRGKSAKTLKPEQIPLLDISKIQSGFSKRVYSRAQLESQRFVDIEGQKKMWNCVFVALGPVVSKEYTDLVTRENAINVRMVDSPQLYVKKKDAPPIPAYKKHYTWALRDDHWRLDKISKAGTTQNPINFRIADSPQLYGKKKEAPANIVYKKHYPPTLHDDVWRLVGIAKDGTLHRKLRSAGIFTVGDFLWLLGRDHQRLRNILGSGLSNRMWENSVEHAKTCSFVGKHYVYYGDDMNGTGVVFNHRNELRGIIVNGKLLPLESLTRMQKISVDLLVKRAYENWDQVVEI